jgi:hypothetical protein
MFCNGMGDFVMDEKTFKTTPEVKTMLVIFLDWQGAIHKEFVPEGESFNAVY